MSAANKFLAAACVLVSIPILYRVAPGAAIVMVIFLLALAYLVCRDDHRP
jgi:hypothetical protein